MNSVQEGDIVEYRFALFCMEHNIPISKPMNNNLPYDFIIEVNNKLFRVQVKKGRKASESSFVFNTKSTYKNTNEFISKSYTKDQIDGFITNFQEQLPNEFFYIPVEKASNSSMSMYFGDSVKNNYNYYKDYSFLEYFNIQENINDNLKNDYEEKYDLCECGNKKLINSTLCSVCSHKKQRKAERPSREELKSYIRTSPFTTIGKYYNISDNAIRQWCEDYGLPRTKKEINSYSDEEWEKV